MFFGYSGKILRVDLTRGTTSTEELDEATSTASTPAARRSPPTSCCGDARARRSAGTGQCPDPGQRAADRRARSPPPPVSPPRRARRSPARFGESEAGGFWGPELKLAGWEAIVHDRPRRGTRSTCGSRTTRSRSGRVAPVEARPGGGAGGDPPGDWATAGRASCRSGWAARTWCATAALTNELRHFNGRTGMGAVMGSKNLKAIAVRGSRQVPRRSPTTRSRIGELGRRLAKLVKEHPRSWDLQVKGHARPDGRA